MPKITNPNYADYYGYLILVIKPAAFNIQDHYTGLYDDEIIIGNYTGDYDGQPHGIEWTCNLEDEAEITFYNEETHKYEVKEFPKFTDAGTYIVKYRVTSKSGNYQTFDSFYTITINKVHHVIRIPAEDVRTVTFNNKPHAVPMIEATDIFDNPVSVTYNLNTGDPKVDTPTDDYIPDRTYAGDHWIYYHIPESRNYFEDDGVYVFRIKKDENAIDFNLDSLVKEYDRTPIEVTATSKYGEVELTYYNWDKSEQLSGAPTDAGKYQVYAYVPEGKFHVNGICDDYQTVTPGFGSDEISWDELGEWAEVLINPRRVEAQIKGFDKVYDSTSDIELDIILDTGIEEEWMNALTVTGTAVSLSGDDAHHNVTATEQEHVGEWYVRINAVPSGYDADANQGMVNPYVTIVDCTTNDPSTNVPDSLGQYEAKFKNYLVRFDKYLMTTDENGNRVCDTVKITPRDMNLTTDSKTMTYGDTVDDAAFYTWAVDGVVDANEELIYSFQIEDAEGNCVSGLSDAENKLDVGTYTISAAVSGDDVENYNVIYDLGTLTVEKRRAYVEVAPDQSKAYSTELPDYPELDYALESQNGRNVSEYNEVGNRGTGVVNGDTIKGTLDRVTNGDYVNDPIGEYAYSVAELNEKNPNYTFYLKAGTDSFAVVEYELNDESCTATLNPTWYYFDRTAKKPDVTVVANGKTLVRNRDFVVKYLNNIEVGTATAVITGIGNYSGTINRYFTIKENTDENVNKLNIGLKGEYTKSYMATNWGYVSNADGYDVFIQYCGKSFKSTPNATLKGNTKTYYAVTKLNGQKLKTTKAYKYYVKAWRKINGKKVYIATSLTIHVAGAKCKTYTNVKSVSVKKTAVTLKVKNHTQISASYKLANKKKKLLNICHAARLRYWSTNKAVAVVTSSGQVVAKGKGSCYIYVMALNGVKTRVRVTVK